MDIIFLKPIPRSALWGGDVFKQYFNYKDFKDDVGQSWCITAQDEINASEVLNGEYQGKTLYDIWLDHPEYFNSKYNDFPFIIGILAPIADLSIQIHPDDEYARKLGYKFGKNEAWYFIEAADNSELVVGTNAKNKEELEQLINEDRWDEIIKKASIKKDDFVNIKAGTLHALPKDVIIYEVQRGSDVTYRFYDYKRKDNNGNYRELHLKQAIEVLKFDSNIEIPERIIEEYPNYTKTTLIANDEYKVTKLDIDGRINYPINNYELFTCIKGEGIINNQKIKKGDSCLIPATINELNIEGNLTILTTKE